MKYFLLRFLDRCFPVRGGKREFRWNRVEKVALAKWFGLGSILLYSPFFSSAKREFGVKTVVYTNSAYVSLLSRYSWAYDSVEPITFSAVLRGLSGAKVDAVLSGEFNSNFSYVFSRVMGKTVLGFHPFADVSVDFDERVHFLENLRKLYEATGGSNFSFQYSPPVYDREKGRKEVEKVVSSPFFLVNPNVSDLLPQKMVPYDLMGEFVELAVKRTGWEFVVLGTARERERCEEFLAIAGLKGINGAGVFSVDGYFFLYETAEFIITTDSAPLHIAQTFSLPTVAFFGPESPVRYGPLFGKHLVITSPLPCSPCLTLATLKRPRCNSNKCMRAIRFENWRERFTDFVDSLR